jgi:hypothetical protein
VVHWFVIERRCQGPGAFGDAVGGTELVEQGEDVGGALCGADSPFPWTRTAVDHILDTPGFSDDERIAMLGGTAAKLLGITA